MSLKNDIVARPLISLPMRLEAYSEEALIELSDAITDELVRRYDELEASLWEVYNYE